MKRSDITDRFPDATDEDIDAILNIHSADIGKHKKTLEAKDAEIAEMKGIKERLAELEKQNMTAEEQAKAAAEAAEAAKREFAIKANTLDVERLFVEAGVPKEEYSPLLSSVVSDDADKSKAAAEGIVAVIKAQAKLAESNVRKELLGNTPKAQVADATPKAMTKEEFSKLGTKEQVEYIQDHPNWKSELQ
jgi:hypothetical protein